MDNGCVLESGRQPQLITPENERGDNTNNPSPPTFFDDPDVPFKPCGPPAPPEPHEPPGSPGLPPGWPPAPSPAGGGERVEPRSSSRERFPPRPSQPELQVLPMFWMMLTMISHHRKKGNGDGPDRRSEHLLTHKHHRYHKLNLWFLPEPDDVSDEDYTAVHPSSPSAGPPPSAQ